METNKPKPASAGQVLRVYWRYIRPEWPLLLVILVTGVILQLADLAAPLFMRQFFNLLTVSSPGPTVGKALAITLGLVALMWFIDWLMRRLSDVANTYYAARVMASLYGDSFDYLLKHSYSFFISNFAGTLTHRISRFVRSFEMISDMVLTQFFPTSIFVVGVIVVLFVRNHTLGTALLVWTILFIVFQVYIAKLRQPSRKARAEADTKVTGTLADAVSNQSTIMQFAGNKHESGVLRGVVQVWQQATLRSWQMDGWTFGAISLFVLVIQVGLLYGAVYFWLQGRLTVGDFVLIQSYLIGTFNQLMGIGYQLRRFYDAFADAGEMVEILQKPHEITDILGAKTLSVTDAKIDFTNVLFFFTDARPVLKDFTLSVPGGQKVALVGHSGAGKSTLTKLLLRMFDIQKGSITIDGQDVKEVSQESLRKAISFVPQEPILFHRTLMENIRYGKLDATDEEVMAAAQKAHCADFIDALPDKYNTYVGERGVKLSGGERQRVAIARAILKNAPILVLDEATSSLDSHSESLIQQALETLMQGKTVLVIAHRLSTIMKMDRIVVIEGGAVAADGTHADLLTQGGLYADLWSIQAGGFLLEDADTEEIPEEIKQKNKLVEENDDEAAPLAESEK
jgi:ATP-binding cassette subfamily B protein